MSVATPAWLVACLCAQWCGTCRDYANVFQRQAWVFRDQACFVWVDVEDHAELLGTLDIENFPTLLVAYESKVLFFGTMTPHEQTLNRLIHSALNGDFKSIDQKEEEALLLSVRKALQKGQLKTTEITRSA